MRIGFDRPDLIPVSRGRPISSAIRDGSSIVAACAVVACLASCLFCLQQGITSPLWLDESWTGAIASETSLSGLTRQIRNEANAPLYYYFIWFWGHGFGISNLSLRVPSILFAIAAPLVGWAGLHRSRPTLACVWAALLALWIPGIVQACNARCYALLSLMAVGTAVLAIRAYEAPTRRRAVAWAAGACLTTLTHYYAGPLALIQGLVLLARYRGRWRDAWPAVLVFLPAFAWIGWHAPRLAALMQPGVAWFHTITVDDLSTILSFFLGSPLAEASIPAALAVGVFLGKPRQGDAGRPIASDPAVLATGLAALAATGLCLGLAAVQPTFTFRYLTPFVPGVLLLVASGIVAASRSRWQPLAVLIGGSLVGAWQVVATENVAANKAFGFETASAWIAQTRPARLAFFWDNPTSRFIVPDQFELVGGFFLRRAGAAVEVEPVYPINHTDMTGSVLAAAGPEGAVLWLYDTMIHDTTAILHPPRLEGTAGLECRNFGIYNLGVLACRPAR